MSLLTSRSYNEELRRKELGSSHSDALIAQNIGRLKFQERGNHSKSRSKLRPSQSITCYHCWSHEEELLQLEE